MPTLTLTPEQLTALRIRIGLDGADTSKDAEITAAYEVALGWVAAFLDRFLIAGTYQEVFTHKRGFSQSLKGYPVLTINSIVDTETGEPLNRSGLSTPGYHVAFENGVLYFDGGVSEHQFTVDYTISDPVVGGLFYAVLSVFDSVYAGTNGGGTVIGGGVIKSISSDGAKVDYDTSSGGGGGSGTDLDTGLPSSVVGILQLYRRWQC
jgi:hypothetical protein